MPRETHVLIHRLIPTLLIALFGTVGPACGRDLTLDEAVQRVTSANRDVLAARRAVESASAGIRQADVGPNPVVSYSATGLSNNPGIGPGSLANKRIDSTWRIDQVLERGNKRDLRIDAAQGNERAARNEVLDVLRQQSLLARVAYADLQQAQGKTEILADTAELFSRTYAAAQARLKAGDLAAADVARVQVDFERAQNDQRVAQGDLSKAQVALAFLIAEENSAPTLRAVDPWPTVLLNEAISDQRSIVLIIAKYVDGRPDVRAQPRHASRQPKGFATSRAVSARVTFPWVRSLSVIPALCRSTALALVSQYHCFSETISLATSSAPRWNATRHSTPSTGRVRSRWRKYFARQQTCEPPASGAHVTRARC